MSENGKRDDIVGRIGPAGEELDPVVLAAAIALREPVASSERFEERVMAAVRHTALEGPHRARPWWQRRTIRLSPAMAGALAASIAVVAFLGARSVSDLPQSPRSAAAPATERGVAMVRFVFVDPNAQHVSVVGSFNHWQKDATPLAATGVPGVWAVSVPLDAGMHEYAFVIDGERWSADPNAPSVTDEFGTQSSIVRIQGPTSS